MRALYGVLALPAVLASCGGSGSDGSPASSPHDPPPVSISAGPAGPAALVDPFIGTGDSSSPDPVGNGKGGSTFPGAALPFGMVQWSPDTPRAAPAGYYYADDSILAFSLTHLNGAGCAAERDFPVFASVHGPDPTAEPGDTFTHASEHASPGFYEVGLGSGIKVDLTATLRTGLARFTFPDGADAHVSIDAGTSRDIVSTRDFDAKIVGDDLVTGSRSAGGFCVSDSSYRVYFAARFDRPFSDAGALHDGEVLPGAREASGVRGGVYLRFATDRTRVVHMKIGLSYVSVEHARANLDAESPGWDFDAVHASAVATWNDYLRRIDVQGGTDDERRGFYSALYHTLLQPAVFSDVDGSYIGFDGAVRPGDGHARYANFSGWDVYRSWIHLVSMIAPKEASDIVRSLVDAGSQCGALPKWSLSNDETGVMVGDPADAFVAGAWAFGARDFDAHAALALMKKGASDPAARCNNYPARPGAAGYLAHHYCPIDDPDAPQGPPSTTLEYASADFAVAQLAKAIGDDATHAEYLDRGSWWRNVFDASFDAGGQKGFVQPRLAADAGGKPAFRNVDPSSTDGFIEGNAAQYTFMVPHDTYGLISALGGDAVMIARLDSLFTELNAGVSRPYFYIGNEPEFGTPWQYVFAGAPERTQAVVRRVLTEAFAPTPGGLPGNDDLGATSAWQVWAMLGLYPEIPGVGGLVLGSPLFPRATISLGSGRELVIVGNGAATDAPYVQSLTIDGVASTKAWITWDAFSKGSTLEMSLGKAPVEGVRLAPADRPPALYP